MSVSSSILFLGAHADDIEIGAGGTCALLCAQGFDVRLVILSDEDVPAIAAQRRQEAIEAGAVLGVPGHNIHFLGLADGHLHCNRQSVGALRELAARHGIKPAAVFTHTDADSHQDHIAATRIAKGAFRNAAFFKYQVRNSAMTSNFAPVVHCSVDQSYDVKLRALALHRSQVGAGRIPIEQVKRFDQRLGAACGGRYGESFELEMQEGASAATELIGRLDSQPFRRLWSPVLASKRLTVLAAPQRRDGYSATSDIVLVTRLQAALMNALPFGIGANPGFRFDVSLSDGVADEAHAAAGSVLILGDPETSPAAAALRHWLGIPGLPAMDARGLLTIAHNPIAARQGRQAYIIAATGSTEAAVAAAAECLLDDARITALLGCATSVYNGHAAVAQVPVAALQLPAHAEHRPATEVSRSRINIGHEGHRPVRASAGGSK